MKRFLFSGLCGLLFSVGALAQNFGGFPPSSKWKQIDTDTARVIFLHGIEDQGQRIATLIHRMAADTPFALGNQGRKINVVLHNRTTLANGYVALAPFRSEFYLVPGSNIFDFGNLPWAENLAVHEYRHVQQFNNMRHGWSKAFYYLFGERGLALANAAAVPDWFWEGDAVVAETALTPQGRGRLPYFLSGYNSLWKEDKDYSWMKLRNGSFRDYVPNHYQLGYLLVNYGYLKYGPRFWQEVIRDASAYKGLFYPFQKAVERHAGVDFRTFRRQALEFYRGRIEKDKPPANRDRKTVSYAFFPQAIGADSLLYLRSAYNRIPAFVLRTPGGDRQLALKSIGSEEWISHRNGTVAYTAYSTHPRWTLVDYSDIVLLDLSTRREKRITRQQRYYTPDLSPSGNSIIAVHLSDTLRAQLHLLNRQGEVLQRIDAPAANDLFVNPRFVNENRVLVAIRNEEAEMYWTLVNLQTGTQQSLTPTSNRTIGLPQAAGDTIYFTANFRGNDDLYAMKLSNRKLYRLTEGQTGFYYPQAQGDSISYSAFTASGLDLRKQALGSLLWQEEAATNLPSALFPVAGAGRNILSGPAKRFAEKRYPKSTGLARFHSWSPDYTDPELTFSLYSDNILNTFSNTLYYRYNQNESSSALGWNTSYGGFFPMLNAGLEYTRGRDLRTTRGLFQVDQVEARAGYNIPLNLTKGKTYHLMNFGSNYVFNRSQVRGLPTGSEPVNRSYLQHFLSWSKQLPRAVQQIYPRFSAATTLQYRHRLDQRGYQFIGLGQVSLPSIANHSIVLQASWQETDTANVLFSNRLANSRGYPDYYYSRMWRASANYHFPLFYPDFGVANIVYLKRVRGNLFYDLTRVYSATRAASRDLRSLGSEVFFDTQWWNMMPITFGVRYSYLLDADFARVGKHRFEITLPLDLIPD